MASPHNSLPSPTSLPPLSSFSFFTGGRAALSLPAVPLATRPPSWSASGMSDGSESVDSSVTSPSSGSSFSFGSPPRAAHQQSRSPTMTPRPRSVAKPSLYPRSPGSVPTEAFVGADAAHQQPSVLRSHTKRKSWSPHGSLPGSSPVEPARRESGLRTAFYRDAEIRSSSATRSNGAAERPSFERPSRYSAWSASSDEAAEMELGDEVPIQSSPEVSVGQQRDSDAHRWATGWAERRLSTNAPAPIRHRHSSYDIRSLLISSEVAASSPATAVSDFAQLGAGDRRPSLDRRAVSDSVLDAVWHQSILPIQPPSARGVSPARSSDWPLSQPFFDRPHPYRRMPSTSTSSANAPRAVTVTATQGELGCDSRRAFSRTSKACDSCRSRKTRCSSLEGSRSCIRCHELGQACAWSEPNKKRGPAIGSTRLRTSRSASGSQPSTSPHSPTFTPKQSPVLTISGWTSAASLDSPVTPSTSLAFDFQAMSTQVEIETPLPCSGWSQPVLDPHTLRRRPPPFARRPKSEMLPSTFSVGPTGEVPGWAPPMLSNGHGSQPRHRPLTFDNRRQPSTPLYRPDVDDQQLVFLGDNTLTLPPLRIAIGRRPSF